MTEISIPKRYWTDLKKKLINEGSGLYEKSVQLKFEAADGKNMQQIALKQDCLKTQDVFRLIQSSPSPKAEPFKLWLAQVANEHLDEMQDSRCSGMLAPRIPNH